MYELPERDTIFPIIHTQASISDGNVQKSICPHSSRQLKQYCTQTSLDSKDLERKLDYMYWLKKPLEGIAETQWRLMATPKVNIHQRKILQQSWQKFQSEAKLSYPIYVENSEWIGVPRFYGIQTFGPVSAAQNHTTLGESMNPDIKFTWELQETAQKPQKSAAQSWLESGGQGIIALPCGAGKTIIGIYLAIKKMRRTLIMVHNKSLMDQWCERIRDSCPSAKVGVIQGKTCEVEGRDFVIGMMQTLCKINNSKQLLDSFGTVIVDECHHAAARTYFQAIIKTCPMYILGISATPRRADLLTHILPWILGPIVFQSKRCDVFPQKIFQLVYQEGCQKVIRYKNGMTGISTMVSRMTRDPKRNYLIHCCIMDALQHVNVSKTLVISDRREHLENMYNHYKNYISCGLHIGGLGREELQNSKLQRVIFATFSMAKEFLDVQGINAIVLATPFTVDAEQVIGRARENLVPEFEHCSTIEEDVAYGESLQHIIWQKTRLPTCVVELCISYCKKKIEPRERYVYDIVDPFDVFEGLAWRHFRVYQNLHYVVKRLQSDVFIKEIENDRLFAL